MTAWVPNEETGQEPKSADAEVPSVRGMSVAEQNGSCIDAADRELVKYCYSTGVDVAGGYARRRY